jgi:hypothetical protein
MSFMKNCIANFLCYESGEIGENTSRRYTTMRFLVALSALVVFVCTSPCLAADPWFVIKDTNDVCRVIEAKEKTPKTIGGPYKTKAEAEKAKEKLCPKSAWFVIKDVNSVCKVIEAEDKTPKTIGGPYKTKEEAEKAKDKLCPKSAWFIIKDVNNVCKVIEAEDKTPKTIGGPYKTKDEAEKAKAKLCKK